MNRIKALGLLASAAAVLVVSACGSSSKSSTNTTTSNAGSATTSAAGSASSGSSGAAKPTGTPIKLGIIVPIQDTVVSEPWIAQGAKIGVAAVNAAGGIDGRPLQLIVCDDQYTPQQAGVCAQKLLITDKVSMLVGDDGTMDAAIAPVVKAAHTISWGDYGASGTSLEDPNTYILAPLESTGILEPKMLPAGVKHIAYVTADAAIAISSSMIVQAAVPKGIGFTVITVPLTATSMQTTCLQVKNTGADWSSSRPIRVKAPPCSKLVTSWVSPAKSMRPPPCRSATLSCRRCPT